MCRFYGLDILVNAGSVFRAALCELCTLSEHYEAWKGLVEAQELVQELKVEVTRLHEENTVTTSLTEGVTRLEGGIRDGQMQRKRDLAILQAQTDTGPGTLPAAARDLTRRHLLLDAEVQKGQSVELTTACF